jgi:peptide/nickel transport system permease protein
MEGGSWNHPAGTDNIGRDVLSRTIHGTRTSMLVGVPATLLSMVLGVSLGLLSGYAKGPIDTVIMRFVDLQRALPMLVVAIAVMAFIGGGILAVLLLLALWSVGFFARLVRGDTLAATAQEYVVASHAIGASPVRIMFRHVLPNVATPVFVLATFMLPRIIIIEASLSFLGMGVPPPAPSWGNMLAEGRTYLQTAWWVVMTPGAVLTITVLSINLVGDRLRDILDPFLRGRAGL